MAVGHLSSPTLAGPMGRHGRCPRRLVPPPGSVVEIGSSRPPLRACAIAMLVAMMLRCVVDNIAEGWG